MRSIRDTGVQFPSTLTSDEKRLKEAYEKLRAIRKAIAATNKVNVSGTVGDNLKTERKTTKRHLQQAQEATEEVKRKVLIGAVSFKKADEKKDSFKRPSLIGRRRVNISNTELLPPNADDDTYKSLPSDDSGTTKKTGESSDINKSPYDSDNCQSATSDTSDVRKPSPNSAAQTISSESDEFDTYKTGEEANASYNCKSAGVHDNGVSDTNSQSSSFDIYKPASNDDGFDNYKPYSTQSFSFDANSGSSSFIGFEQPKPCRGPCLYIRGYDLIADSLRNVFSKYGVINRVFVEERQKSAFITYATTAEAETAIKEMDGNMVNGITLRVSFARRQNQCSDSGRFRSSKSFDRNNDNNDRGGSDRSNRSRSQGNFFRGNERVRYRGEKSRRSRSRGHTYEGESSLLPASSTENNDDFLSGPNKVSSDEGSAAEASYAKDDFWPSGTQSRGRTNEGSNVEKDNNNQEDNFNTYKSTIAVNEKDDFVNVKDDYFDRYKPFSDDGRGDSTSTKSRETSDGNYQETVVKRHGGYEHRSCERRGGFDNDRCRSFRCDERGGRMPRRGSQIRGDPLWHSKRQNNELRGGKYCSNANSDVSQKNSWLTKNESGDKNDLWTSGDHHSSAHSKNANDNKESESQEKDNVKDDFWPSSYHQSSDRNDESSHIPVERLGEDEPFRRGTQGDYRNGGRGADGNAGFRRQRRGFDKKNARPDDEEGKSSCWPSEWPNADNKPLTDSWPVSSDGKTPSFLPLPPPMSKVQVAWSEATKKSSEEVAAVITKKETTVVQHKTEIRMQVSYGEDDPFA
ncbi:immunodominant antigen homologue, putative [Brugia malayi]|uniref:Negative elongation factor E n=1 Tax=Brugia malayi TaxID=6279 RepID=A0A4E9F139_BRUMA|nr:immunodominant antigen homologue, putative [Brugia malayi]VIO89462.1 immunodominant antigen homologue, putative [Brugia malayi]